MATLEQIRARIESKLDDGAVQRPRSWQVDAQINSTIDFYENDEFWFNQEIATLTTTATGNDRILASIPADFKSIIEPNGLVVIQGNIRYPLDHITALKFDTLDVSAIGRPVWYTYRDGNFELYYIPNQEYEVRLFYTKKYDDLSADGSNDFTNFAPRLLEYRTLADLLLDFREDDPRGTRYLARAEEEFNKIQSETYNRTATGNLSVETIIDGERGYFYENFY